MNQSAGRPDPDTAPFRHLLDEHQWPDAVGLPPSYLTVLWLVQAAMLLGASAVAMFQPSAVYGLLYVESGTFDYDAARVAVDVLRVTGPLYFGLALFTMYAEMRDANWMRADFARMFVPPITMSAWFLGTTAADRNSWGTVVLLLATCVFLGLNLATVVNDRSVRPARGSADTKPPALWSLWMFQGLAYGVLSIITFFFPQLVIDAIGAQAPRAGGYHAAALDSLHNLAGPLLAMSILSLYATQLQRRWHWRELAQIFAVWQILGAVVLLVSFDPGSYAGWSLYLFVPFLVLALGNYAATRATGGSIDTHEIDEDPEGWVWLDLLTGPVMVLQMFLKGGRATHLHGPAARGRYIHDPDPAVPSNPFFKPTGDLPAHLSPDDDAAPGTHSAPALMRFANLTIADDAGLDIRGASFKLSDHPITSPFDIMMNTGSYAALSDVVTFASFVLSKWMPVAVSRAVTRSSIQTREGAVAGLRRAPSCFTKMHYYGQLVRHWYDAEERLYLVRYRLVPYAEPFASSTPAAERPAPIPDDGVLEQADDQSEVWIRTRKADQHGTDPAYLTHALRDRLSPSTPAWFRFEAQFHAHDALEGLAWYDPSVDWPAAHAPWLGLGSIRLDEALSAAQSEVLFFNSDNHPRCLGVPVSSGVRDPRSLADSERRVVRRLQPIRLWIYHRFGLPRRG